MNFLNKLVRTLAVLVILVLIVAAFLPDHFELKAKTEIPLKKDFVQAQLLNFEHWEHWSPMFKADSTSKIQVQSPQRATWQGQLIGEGELNFTSITDTLLKMKVSFTKPHEQFVLDEWQLTAVDEKTTSILWTSQGPLGYPLERVFGIFLNGRFQESFQRGLGSFAEYLVQTDSLQQIELQTQAHQDSLSNPVDSLEK